MPFLLFVLLGLPGGNSVVDDPDDFLFFLKEKRALLAQPKRDMVHKVEKKLSSKQRKVWDDYWMYPGYLKEEYHAALMEEGILPPDLVRVVVEFLGFPSDKTQDKQHKGQSEWEKKLFGYA